MYSSFMNWRQIQLIQLMDIKPRHHSFFQLDDIIQKFKKFMCNYSLKSRNKATNTPTYRRAKEEEKNRQLKKAARLYYQAARRDEKVQSAVKDFASILHQLGETEKAVKFLEEMFTYVKPLCDEIDCQKYQNLKRNFINQVNEPTGKHNITRILIDLKNLPEIQNKGDYDLLYKFFKDPTRVDEFIRYVGLGLKETSKNGRFFMLTFSTFSQAKKTIDKFKFEQWFALDAYWLNEKKKIVCEVQNGQNQFKTMKIVEEVIKEKLNNLPTLQLENEERMYIAKNLMSSSWQVTEDKKFNEVRPFD